MTKEEKNKKKIKKSIEAEFDKCIENLISKGYSIKVVSSKNEVPDLVNIKNSSNTIKICKTNLRLDLSKLFSFARDIRVEWYSYMNTSFLTCPKRISTPPSIKKVCDDTSYITRSSITTEIHNFPYSSIAISKPFISISDNILAPNSNHKGYYRIMFEYRIQLFTP